MASTDKTFIKYIENKQEVHEEEKDITPNQLMVWSKNRYDIVLKNNFWNAPNSEEYKIIALQA